MFTRIRGYVKLSIVATQLLCVMLVLDFAGKKKRKIIVNLVLGLPKVRVQAFYTCVYLKTQSKLQYSYCVNNRPIGQRQDLGYKGCQTVKQKNNKIKK